MFAASKSSRAAATTDPLFPYVPLLLETTSTNGQQNNTFLDSGTANGGVGFTITSNGTPTQGSVTPYWPNGYWSNYFAGATNYLTTPSISAIGTTDFSQELWVYPTSAIASDNIVFDAGVGAGTFLILTTTTVIGGVNGAVGITSSAYTVPANQWTHLVYCRVGTTMSLFANGTRIGTTTNSTSITAGSYKIGCASDITRFFTGYISNLRFVSGSGSSPYNPASTTITVPTTPLTPVSGTSLLTCQSNRFKDNSTNNFAITASGTPKVQAFQPFSPTASYTAAAYGGSGYFNGSTDYLSLADNTALQLSTGDFTIEGWFYISGATSTAYNLISKGAAATGWSLNTTTGARIQFSYTASNLTGATTTLVQGAWYHIAVVRSGSSSGNLKIYLNGVQEIASAGAVNDDFNQTSTMYISASRTATVPLNGYSSNVRVVKGTAVYTGAFTPPTLAPLTIAGSTSAASYSSTTNVNTSFASSATSLLTNFTNAGIYDAAVQNNVITVGDAQASTTQSKWSPTSMKFDGTGDWLTAIDNPQLQLGTGDFTIDGWVYLSANGIVYGLVSKGTATTGWSVNVTVLNKLQFSYTTSNLTGATSLAASTWYYFAVVRSGSATGNLKVYLNGTVDATSGGAVTDNFNQTSILYVGADRIGTSPLNGYLQDVRVTKAARTITTPTSAFPTK
jgi:hypothetical protein